MNAEVTIDTDLVREQADPYQNKLASEKRADQFAAEVSIPREKLDKFIASVRPLYSVQIIRKFAFTNAVHPGIVVGQLQHCREISYAHSRNMLEKVRDIVTSSSLTVWMGIHTNKGNERRNTSQAKLKPLWKGNRREQGNLEELKVQPRKAEVVQVVERENGENWESSVDRH